MTAHMYYDEIDPPKRAQIELFSISNESMCNACEWIEWVESQGEILMDVVCDDGLVFVVRVEK